MSREGGGRRPPALPTPAAPLLGRAHLLGAARRLLLARDVRLLSLVGPPGVGKTRLALEVAAGLGGAFADGVWFVALGPLTAPAAVVPAIARALGVRAAPGARDAAGADGVPPPLALAGRLRSRRRLLVLDNFEHVHAAGPQVAALLAATTRLKVLVTSRRPLRVRGEQELPVPPLALPDAPPPGGGAAAPLAAVLASPAVALFCQRARAVRPDFAPTEADAGVLPALCRRLDGLPLALELAAAWAKVLSPPALLARLERRLPLLADGALDLPARQQTLRGAIAWSDELLPEEERALFRRLGVFAGGCDLEAAEAVCAPAEAPRPDLLAPLARLVDASLLQRAETPGGVRVTMLETLREYALERLAAAGEHDAVARRHAAYFAGLAERAAPRLRGPEQLAWLDRLAGEHANLQTALDWALGRAAAGDADAEAHGARLAGVLWPYWAVRGSWSDARRWQTALLARGGRRRAAGPWAQALTGAGVRAEYAGDHTEASALLEEALRRARAARDGGATGDALLALADVAVRRGDPAGARARLDEALALARRAADRPRIAWALNLLGVAAAAGGDHAAAAAWLEEALAIRWELGDRRQIAVSLNDLGHVALARGDPAAARARHEQSLAVRRALGHRYGVARALAGLGGAAAAQGDVAAAGAALLESLAVCRELHEPQGLLIALAGCARLAAARGQAERAVRLASAATGLGEALGTPLPALWRDQFPQWLEPVRRALPAPVAERAARDGRALSVEQAVADARAAAAGGAAAAPPASPLTPRELEVAALVARGYTSRRIAAELIIAERTAMRHVDHIRTKLGLHSRAQIAAWTVEHGLLPRPRP